MAAEYTYNPFTGRRRRKPRKRTSAKRRATESSTVNERLVAKKARTHACDALERINTSAQLVCSILAARGLQVIDSHGLQNDVWAVLFLAAVNFLSGCYSTLIHCLAIDAYFLDIPNNEEPGGRHTPLAHKRIDDFPTDDHAYQWTNFNRAELRDLIRLWGLPENFEVPRKGTAAHYVFNNEELVIFFLNAMKSADRKTDICTMKLGGDDGRWGVGCNWLVRYLDARYSHLLGPESLGLWIDDVPYFAQKMGEAAAQDRYQRDRNGNVIRWLPGLDIDPADFGPFGILDCNETRVCTPGSGPEGDWEDAPRKQGWYEIQRAFFGGHHKQHGLKTLTIILPNGIEAGFFGPVSVRP